MNTNNTMGNGIDGKSNTAPADRTAQDNRDENLFFADTNDMTDVNASVFATDFGPYNLSRRQ